MHKIRDLLKRSTRAVAFQEVPSGAASYKGTCSYPLNQVLPNGIYNRIDLDAGGLFRIVGSLTSEARPELIPEVYLDSYRVPFLQYYRVSRPDLPESGHPFSGFQPGLVLEYLLPEDLCGREYKLLSVFLESYIHFKSEGPFRFVSPDYRSLFDSERVRHQEEVYGSGPPNSRVHPEVLELAKTLPSPILDFGCGSGALIAELESLHIKAQGLELESAPFVPSIPPSRLSSITLYDGSFPAPFESGSFRSVFCSEVLEHIPDYRGAIKELARIASEKVVITVPDASAIPLGSRHHLVPWHLLESTHVNFFNQASLEFYLRPHFSQIDFGRICGCQMNDTTFYVSLAAVCRK